MDSVASGTAFDTWAIVNKYLWNEDGMQIGWFSLQAFSICQTTGCQQMTFMGLVRKQENTVSTLTSLAPTLPASGDQRRLKETLQSAPGPQEDISTCFLHEQEISSAPGSVIRSMLSVTSGGPGSMIFTVGLCKRGPTCSWSVYPCLSPETPEP